MYIYSDWVSAIFYQGKPSGPRLRNHSIVTIKNGKRTFPKDFLCEFGMIENIKPAKDQYIDK